MQPLNKSLKLFHVSTQLSTAAYFTWLLLVSVLTHIEHVHFISLALVTFRFIIIFGQVVVRILRVFFHSSNITFFWCNLSETGIYICWVNVYLLFPFSSSYQFFALSFCAFVKLSLPLSLSLIVFAVDGEPREIQFWIANAKGSSFFSLAVHGQTLFR